ncbi:hypothetical protein K438DRAFT_1774145 [Mycena galopus ATCC 62051]|nr:hypothetical protein K438DRAFT_1774145 [Mycena galopus ATCC 62051]
MQSKDGDRNPRILLVVSAAHTLYSLAWPPAKQSKKRMGDSGFWRESLEREILKCRVGLNPQNGKGLIWCRRKSAETTLPTRQERATATGGGVVRGMKDRKTGTPQDEAGCMTYEVGSSLTTQFQESFLETSLGGVVNQRNWERNKANTCARMQEKCQRTSVLFVVESLAGRPTERKMKGEVVRTRTGDRDKQEAVWTRTCRRNQEESKASKKRAHHAPSSGAERPRKGGAFNKCGVSLNTVIDSEKDLATLARGF